MKWYDPTIMTPSSNAAEMADTWNDITGEGIPFIHDVIHYNFHQNDNKSVLYDLVFSFDQFDPNGGTITSGVYIPQYDGNNYIHGYTCEVCNDGTLIAPSDVVVSTPNYTYNTITDVADDCLLTITQLGAVEGTSIINYNELLSGPGLYITDMTSNTVDDWIGYSYSSGNNISTSSCYSDPNYTCNYCVGPEKVDCIEKDGCNGQTILGECFENIDSPGSGVTSILSNNPFRHTWETDVYQEGNQDGRFYNSLQTSPYDFENIVLVQEIHILIQIILM